MLLGLTLLAVRIAFDRVVAPPHDLGHADRIAVIYAIGDNEKVSAFVDHFVAYASRSGKLHILNAVDNNQHASFDEKSLRSLRKTHPADAYVGVSLFTCAVAERAGEVGETDNDGRRLRKRVLWLDAVCSAKVDVRRPDGKRLLTFMVHGEGTSPRVSALGDDERDIALEQAARYAAISAAESIAPRVLRESIELDDTAPYFDEGFAFINADRFAEARAIWQQAAARHKDSAALQYDLAVVSEAIGDIPTAQAYYANATRMAPADSRYRAAYEVFKKRNGVTPARRRP